MDRQGLKIILDGLKNNPQCPHGPTLQFERIKNGSPRRYFACSAYRDRKACSFFWWADDVFTEEKKEVWKLRTRDVLPTVNPKELHERLKKILDVPSNERYFCHTCSLLLLEDERELHKGHDVARGGSDYHIQHPTKLLRPEESNKKEAQYYFTQRTTEVFISVLKKMNKKHILCVGSPSLHEAIQKDKSMKSLLMDIDWRYHSFYSPSQFCWFNMFNQHFFLGKLGRKTLREFLEGASGEGVALVMDPPFGGRVEALSLACQQFEKVHNKVCGTSGGKLTIFWTFPYFMESQITALCPDFKMLDYKVEYINDSQRKTKLNSRKFGSAVRIFTNATAVVVFPRKDGYKFCKICQIFVSSENRHCAKCNQCTSKDGRRYVHCDLCERCVKPTWTHCDVCNRCCLPEHACMAYECKKECFGCGTFGHKRKDCPQENNEDEAKENKKRKLKENS